MEEGITEQDTGPRVSAVSCHSSSQHPDPSSLEFPKNRTHVGRVHCSHGDSIGSTKKNNPCPSPDHKTTEEETPSVYLKGWTTR